MKVPTNALLDGLPTEYKPSLMARMVHVLLPISRIIYRPHETPRYAHFMTSGATSIVTFMQNGSGIEVGLIGREGLVEAVHLLGDASIATTGIVQVEGSAWRIPLAELRKEFLSCEPLRRAILQGVQEQCVLLGQLMACNRLHEVEPILARWLLMAQDRLGTDQFALTQEFLAEMIGVRRTTVTLAAGSLQRGGLIEYKRGHIRVLNRRGLEDAACECYQVVRNSSRRLAGTDILRTAV